MRKAAAPPGVARLLLLVALPQEDREPILGDLHEVFGRRRRVHGVTRARLWYWGQALSFSVRFLLERRTERKAWIHTHGIGRQDMGGIIEAWGRDLAHAVRGLIRAPGFTAVTVATLALAIGANTAIFSVVNAVLLEPLPYPHADRLVSIRASAPGSDLPEEFGPGTEFYVQYRENATTLEDLGLFGGGQTTVRADDHVERLFVATASPSLFSTLGVAPVLGRLPTDEDEEGTVIVLSHWLWTDWFGADPDVLGRSIEVSGALRAVVGVMGSDFRFPQERISLWVHDLPTEPIRPGGFGLGLVGRMTPEADHASVTAQLASLAERLPERFGGSPQYREIIAQHRPIVRSLEQQLVGPIGGPLWILLGTVGVVLLIACANVANLLIVRSESRRRDVAVRRAIGAGRVGLIRAQMAEAFFLAAAGGVVGVVLAWVGIPILVRAAPEGLPRISAVGIDGAGLVFTAGAVILATCVAGFLPAVRFSNPRLVGGLQSAERVGSESNHMTRDALVVVQTAAALVLLVGSGLLLQSFRALSRVDPGYDTRDIFSFQTAPNPREHGLSDAPTFARFHHTFMDRLTALPGVESVGLALTLPLDEGAGLTRFATDRTGDAEAAQPLIRFTAVGGDYFQTMGIELLRGRYLERVEEVTGQVDGIVSERAAEILWPDEEPLGRRLRMASDTTGNWIRVVGVVEDIMLEDFRQEGPDPMIYLPMIGHTARSWVVGTPAYVVRTDRAESIAPEVRDLVREISPDAPMYRVFTMAGLAERSFSRLSFTMLTLGIAAGLALVLGAVGLFGVLSYVVSQRTREIGIRMALGARASELRRMVVVQGGRVTLVGVVVGVLGALGLTRVLESLLFGVGAMDAPTFVSVSVLMLAVALAASYIPARRASAVDPIQSLRAE